MHVRLGQPPCASRLERVPRSSFKVIERIGAPLARVRAGARACARAPGQLSKSGRESARRGRALGEGARVRARPGSAVKVRERVCAPLARVR